MCEKTYIKRKQKCSFENFVKILKKTIDLVGLRWYIMVTLNEQVLFLRKIIKIQKKFKFSLTNQIASVIIVAA